MTYVPYCFKFWPRHLFLSSNFLPQPLNETGDYTRPAFITRNSESKFFRWWILMAAGDACVPLDTVYHEIYSVVHSHHVYKSVWLPVIEQLFLEKQPAGQFTWSIYSGSDKGFSDSELHSVRKFIHRSRHILVHKGALSSTVQLLSYYWEKEERKSLRSTM